MAKLIWACVGMPYGWWMYLLGLAVGYYVLPYFRR